MKAPLHLFEGYGVELEYMIVGVDDLAVLPVTDELLCAAAGEYTSEWEAGALAWSNELVLHVVELKTNGPVASLAGLAAPFQADVARVEELLAPLSGRLMPSAMHPWMDPDRETRLWPHEYNQVYETYHRIFGCQGHGWSNLQSVHLNLPFADDAEFARLHAAIRLLMPIMPALAASSPIVERQASGVMDRRLAAYRENSARIRSITGDVIPEPVFSRQAYQREIFERMYADIAPHDPEGVLRHEWLNSRGAIARFDRRTIEIRVLDVQECPAADIAICAAISGVLRAMCDERWTSLDEQQAWSVEPLADIFSAVTRDAEQTPIENAAYLKMFGYSQSSATAGELWRHLAAAIENQLDDAASRAALEVILAEGPLARRIVQALDARPGPSALADVYRRLCDCLSTGRMFHARV